MRDPKRIMPFCNTLGTIWSAVPDWRLSQLMCNAIGAYINEHGHDPFHMEDSEFLMYLCNYVNEVTKNAENR
jgi:hypothetical protein